MQELKAELRTTLKNNLKKKKELNNSFTLAMRDSNRAPYTNLCVPEQQKTANLYRNRSKRLEGDLFH